MERLQEILLYLLRLGLWGKTGEQHAKLALSQEEWVRIFRLSCVQTVQGTVYDGVLELPPDEQPDPAFLASWCAQVDSIRKRNIKQQVQLTQLEHFFAQEHGLRFCLEKGQTIARYYRQPLHRYCGDLDLWFGPEERVLQANDLMETTGIKVNRGGNFDSSYQFYGTEVEHHSHLIELHNPWKQKALRAWEREIFEQSTDAPVPCANLLLQVTHILKHQLNHGIGLRQICDLAVSIQSMEYDREEFRELCRRYGVYRWTRLLFSLLHEALGVPLEKLPFAKGYNPRALLNEIWASGDFGHYDTRFGSRPQGKWAGKMHTFSIMWHKMKIFFFYAPDESFWSIFGLGVLRILEAMHLVKPVSTQ